MLSRPTYCLSRAHREPKKHRRASFACLLAYTYMYENFFLESNTQSLKGVIAGLGKKPAHAAPEGLRNYGKPKFPGFLMVFWYPLLYNGFRVFGHGRLGFTMNPSNKELPLTRTHRVDGAQVDFSPVNPPCVHNTVERHVPTPLPQTAGRPAGQSRTTPRLPVAGSRPSWAR